MIADRGIISVIVPVYNVEKYLVRCLDSIINNSYQNLEIICVNDGSPDNSIDILYQYAKKDSRIIVLTKENGGLSSARNYGLLHSSGEYVTFVDSDDWVHPRYFEILLSGYLNSEVDAVICGFEQVNEFDNRFVDYSEEALALKTWQISIDELLHNKEYKMFKVYSCGVLYRRDKIVHLFPEGIKVIEDNIFNLLNLPLYSNVAIINLQIYFYYYNQESIMHTYECSDAFNGLIWLSEKMERGEITDKLQIKEAVEFIYTRSLFYRYIFVKMGQRKEARAKSIFCYKKIRRYDGCIDGYKKCVYKICMMFPGLYSLYKTVRGGNSDLKKVFSLAEGKYIKDK